MRKMAFSVLVVCLCCLLAGFGSRLPGMELLFGIALPYLASAVCLGGLLYRIMGWLRSPVPFAIQTTCGQADSLRYIRHERFAAPSTGRDVLGSLLLDVLLFRPLFRNTRTRMHAGAHLSHASAKGLWGCALLFHYSLLLVVLAHLRLFLNPVPEWLSLLLLLDTPLEIGSPPLHISSALLLVALVLLLLRRLVRVQVRYISLLNDYFPLFLLLGIVISGLLMRHLLRTDIDLVRIKLLAVSLLAFRPEIGPGIGAIFYIHLFLVCLLLVYLPFSKLIHMVGIFMSPTRVMRNDSRAQRHVNPWNPEIRPYAYAEYEADFYDCMVAAKIPVEGDAAVDPALREEKRPCP